MVITAAAVLIRESIEPAPQRLDLRGAALLTGTLITLTGGLVRLGETGPDGIVDLLLAMTVTGLLTGLVATTVPRGIGVVTESPIAAVANDPLERSSGS